MDSPAKRLEHAAGWHIRRSWFRWRTHQELVERNRYYGLLTAVSCAGARLESISETTSR